MEWVEVRGETLAAAEEEALDQLGVARDDAEFEVVQEPENRWMGLKKTEARVRARVKPTQPRAKAEGGRNSRRPRGKRGKQSGNSRGGRDSQRSSQGKQDTKQGGGGTAKSADQGSRSGGRGKGRGQDNRQGSAKSGQSGQRRQTQSQTNKEPAVNDSSPSGGLVPLEEQQKVVTDFLEGVVSGFGLEGTVSAHVEEDTIIGTVDGSGLGLLIGPRGGTLQAIQELSRSALQRSSDGRDTSRLRIDVGGYRERRRVALVDFALGQAAEVKESGDNVALEPMSSLDRKTVHDAIMDVEGVKSTSEGEDPYRRVVLLPDA